jgi:hypothetical protein
MGFVVDVSWCVIRFYEFLICTFFLSTMVGCATAPHVRADEWIAGYGPGLQAAIEAAEKADQAHSLISDTSVNDMRANTEKREQVATLVTAARDAYRRAKSYKLKGCAKNDAVTFGEIIGATPYEEAAWVSDFSSIDPVDLAAVIPLANSPIQLVAAEQVYWRSQDADTSSMQRFLYLISSRGKVILQLPRCKWSWPEADIDNGFSSPEWRPVMGDESSFGRGFGKLLLGDEVNIEDLVVDIKR